MLSIAQMGASAVLVIVFAAWLWVIIDILKQQERIRVPYFLSVIFPNYVEVDRAEVPRKGAWQYVGRNPMAQNDTFFDKIEEYRSDFDR